MEGREYKSADGLFGLRLPAICVHRLVELCGEAGNNETGGILVGTYNEALDCARVVKVLPPPTDSRRGRTWFQRGVRGLQKLLDRFWQAERQYYLGEWHFHPYAAPSPSGRDIAQMEDIAGADSYHCPEPLLIILGGDPRASWRIRAFTFPRGRGRMELFPCSNSKHFADA